MHLSDWRLRDFVDQRRLLHEFLRVKVDLLPEIDYQSVFFCQLSLEVLELPSQQSIGAGFDHVLNTGVFLSFLGSKLLDQNLAFHQLLVQTLDLGVELFLEEGNLIPQLLVVELVRLKLIS